MDCKNLQYKHSAPKLLLAGYEKDRQKKGKQSVQLISLVFNRLPRQHEIDHSPNVGTDVGTVSLSKNRDCAYRLKRTNKNDAFSQTTSVFEVKRFDFLLNQSNHAPN